LSLLVVVFTPLIHCASPPQDISPREVRRFTSLLRRAYSMRVGVDVENAFKLLGEQFNQIDDDMMLIKQVLDGQRWACSCSVGALCWRSSR
jgi:hypothetical protein